ncbi:hypothetical protein [Microbacterium sp. NPDC055357]
MTMSAASTSLQRTYRYVRLSLVGIVVMLAAAIAVQWIDSGPLGSVSAAYYTAAGPIFVGGVFAVALALLVLSGRSFGQVSLDLAAIVAPLIAVVPAPVFAGDVPGLTLTCPSGVEPCVPEAFVPAVATGMTALLVTAAVGWGSVFVLAIVQGAVSRRLLTLVVSGVLIAATTVWWFAASDSFLRVGHVIAAASFFAFIALAALASGIDAGRARAFGYRAVYLTIAIAIVAILLALLAVVIAGSLGAAVPEPWGISPVFLGEAAALVLFAAFWVAQTIETWNDPDPTFRSGAAGNRLSAPR